MIKYNFANPVIQFIIFIVSIKVLLFPSTIKIILLSKDFKGIHKFSSKFQIQYNETVRYETDSQEVKRKGLAI
jgi:hypothetical protein